MSVPGRSGFGSEVVMGTGGGENSSFYGMVVESFEFYCIFYHIIYSIELKLIEFILHFFC